MIPTNHEQTFRKGARIAALLFLLVAASASAQVAITGKAGTLGLGAEVTFGLFPQIDGRLGVNAFTYSDHREASHIEYEADARLRTATALLDWHPGGHAFRLTGGMVWNDNRVEGRSIPSASGTYDIAGVQVPVSFVQRLDARADFDPVAPYAGIGWGNPITSTRRAGVAFDLGVIFQGKARVHLNPVIPTGSPILTTPGARDAPNLLIQQEERDLEKEAADYEYYPVVSLGVWYRF
jgi:hypothetical protein